MFANAEKRIIVASFASHIHRVQQVLDAAQEYGRKVAFVGRSMVRNMGIARDLGYLHVPAGLVVDLKTLDDLPDDEVVLVCTGSQGEPMAALSRMANRDHQIRIVQGDTVILASSLIPGNENAVYRVINGLTRWGATSCTRATRRSTSPATPRPASCSTSTTSASRATSCRSTANGVTCGPTPNSAL